MGGLLLTSIGSGQMISRTGVFKPFPIAGTAIMVAGLILLSRMDALQTAVDYADLGVATSGATLFRSIGGSVGTAVLGSIFSNRLANELERLLPAGAASRVSGGVAGNPAVLDRLPARVHTAYVTAFTRASRRRQRG